MKLEDLSIGQRVKGPSGAVYVVQVIEWLQDVGSSVKRMHKAMLESDDALTINPMNPATRSGVIVVDQIALEGFVPWEGEPLCS